MSTTSAASIGGTLTGGVQDVSAILPLIGTEQCDKHVGSALTGGYLYAAATPLSIFGSLGIVKAGISILISSTSIFIPHISISFHDFRPSVKFLGKKKWFGGKMLKDAGFQLTGTVAPLIGMDGHRFKAETKLIRLLEEKHIDDPERVSVSWKSHQWNLMLVLSTIFAATFSVVPYIALLGGSASWRPNHVHLPWSYPILRIAGSCVAVITSQLIIQSRVISLMKNRIIFMTLQKRLDTEYKEQFDAWLKDPKFQWDSNLPAEQCIWILKQYLLSSESSVQSTEDSEDGHHASDQTDTSSIKEVASPAHHSIKMTPPPSLLNDLHQYQQEHFPSPRRNAAFTLLRWFILGFSLPATIAGYIGCFTLVGATPSTGNGPLVWVGLEAALAILRIFIWASNPKFDEETEVILELELSDRQPIMITTNDYNPYITDSDHGSQKPFTLIPEHEFLAHITAFTGPLDQFQKADNFALFFTLTTEYEAHEERWLSKKHSNGMCLFLTVFDFYMQVGVTFVSSNISFNYYDVTVKYNTISRAFEARVQSEKRPTHHWHMEDDSLLSSLEIYYDYIASALQQRDTNKMTAILPWNWDLSPHSGPTNRTDPDARFPFPLMTTPEDQLYLHQGYEHHLKSELFSTWSRWVVTDMSNIRSDTLLDCHEALKDVTSERARWELTELDNQLAWGWALRELVVLMLSLELEDILRVKMERCISKVNRGQVGGHLETWMRSEFDIGRRKRLEQEKEAVKKRMEMAMKEAGERADSEGRSWKKDSQGFSSGWNLSVHFIDKQWFAGTNGQSQDFRTAEFELIELIANCETTRWYSNERLVFVERFKKKVSYDHWSPQHQIEVDLMKSTIERVRQCPANTTRNELDAAYEYPDPDSEATKKFAELLLSSSKGKACSASVYDTDGCRKEAVCDVIAKNTTRSVLNVNPDIVAFIPPNAHLLFLSCRDRERGVEPPFVQQNRDRWWSQQTTNSSTFYLTPQHVSGSHSCYCQTTQTIAHILIFLTVSSTVRVRVLHHGEATKVSLQENGEELGWISTITPKFQLHDFKKFVLPPGAHELELVPQIDSKLKPGRTIDGYFLKDIFIGLSDNPTNNSARAKTRPRVLAITKDVTRKKGSELVENTLTIDGKGDLNGEEGDTAYKVWGSSVIDVMK